MSDPMTNVEIEDVLSSIRRLVSEDLRGPDKAVPRVEGGLPPGPPVKGEGDAAVAKLVLTPAFRVAEPPAEAAADETDAAGGDWLRDADADAAIPTDSADPAEGAGTLEDTIAELEAAVAGIDDAFETEESDLAEAGGQGMPGFADVGEAAPSPDAAEDGDPAEAGADVRDEDAGAAPPWKSLRTSTATLRSAPMWQSGDADADEGGDAPVDSAEPTSDDDLMVAPVAGDAMRFGRVADQDGGVQSDMAEAGPASDETDAGSPGSGAAAGGAVLFGAAAFRSPRIIRPADYAADTGVAAAPAPAPEPENDGAPGQDPVVDPNTDGGLDRSGADPTEPAAQTQAVSMLRAMRTGRSAWAKCRTRCRMMPPRMRGCSIRRTIW